MIMTKLTKKTQEAKRALALFMAIIIAATCVQMSAVTAQAVTTAGTKTVTYGNTITFTSSSSPSVNSSSHLKLKTKSGNKYTYTATKAGYTYVTIKSGSVKKVYTVIIKPAEVSTHPLNYKYYNKKTGKWTFKWNKQSGVTTYQVAYRKNSSSSWTITSVNTNSLTVSSGMAKVRGVVKIGSTTYYGEWSTIRYTTYAE